MLTTPTDNSIPAPNPVGEGGMRPDTEADTPDDRIGRLIRPMIADAQEYIETAIAPMRAKATRYYNSEPLGWEEEGRSKIVTSDVRDAVRAVMPTLLRLFTGPERYVEYAPRGKNSEKLALQRTDYVNYCLNEEPNSAFLLFYAWFKDTLVRRIGLVKWWWDASEVTEETRYTGLAQESLDALLTDPDVRIDPEDLAQAPADEQAGVPETYSVVVTRVLHYGQLRVAPVPGEEILWDRNARDFLSARIVVHTREPRVDEVLAMGYEWDEIKDHVGPSSYHTQAEEVQARTEQNNPDPVGETVQDEMTRPIRFCESYVRMEDPEDPKGKVKLFKVNSIGDQHHVLDYEPVSHIPIAYLIADPEPHTIDGFSMADDTMGFQEINSAVWRGGLDSLALALTPRILADENGVNLADLMNTEIGAVTRTRGGVTDKVQEIAHKFVGADIQPFFDGIADMKESRLGQSRASLGLDADALQSATKAAVTGTFSKAQERTEMLARIFSETGVRQMYKGILRTLVEHQDRKRTIRLRGEWVDCDPRSWNAEMDVVVNVALGAGLTEEKIKVLSGIIDKMEAVLQTYGPQNPLVGLAQYRNALARATELLGYPNPDEFWKPLTPEQEQQMAQAVQSQAQQPPQDPAAMAQAQAALMKIKLEEQKLQAEIANQQAELQLKREAQMLEDDRLREQAAADRVLTLHELALKYQGAMTRAEMDQEIAKEKLVADAHTRQAIARINADAAQSGGGSA